jgi:predicted DNA-binding transcriptional regulator AlpA
MRPMGHTALNKLPGTPAQVVLLNRHEVCAIAGCTYPTLWMRMRRGEFPRARIVGGKSMWLSSEVQAWIAALPVRRLKGDAEPEHQATVS